MCKNEGKKGFVSKKRVFLGSLFGILKLSNLEVYLLYLPNFLLE